MWRDLTKRASNQPLGDKSHPLSPGRSSFDLLIMSSKCLLGHFLPSLISSDVKRESYRWMSGVWKVAPPSGGSVGCSICVQTEAAFINLTNVLHRFKLWKLHIIHMKKVREEKVRHIFNEFCIFHHQPTFNETERERGRAREMEWKANEDEQLWYLSVMWRFLPGFISFLLCKHHCFHSKWGGGGRVSHVSHAPHIEFDKLRWEETTEHVEGATAWLVWPLWSFPHPNSWAALSKRYGWKGGKT